MPVQADIPLHDHTLGPPQRNWLPLATLIVGLLAVGYWSVGLYYLTLSVSEPPHDLKMRWQELQYVARGIDPLDVIHGRIPPDPEIGKVRGDAGYTSWSYSIAEIFVTRLPYPVVRFYFAAICVLSMVVIAWWSYARGLPHGSGAGRLLAVAALAPSGFVVALRFGNYAIPVTALILLLTICEQRKMHWLAGVSLGLAMIKPHLAALFIFVLLVRGNWRGALMAVLLVLAAMALAAWRLSTGPIEMLQSMFSQSKTFGLATFGIFDFLRDWGVDVGLIVKMGLVLGVVTTGLLTWRYRNADLFTLICIPAVITQLCTYHWRYDFIQLLILLTMLGEAAFRTGRRAVWIAFWMVGLTLWFPLRLSYYVGPVPYLYFASWIFGLIMIIRTDREGRSSLVDNLTAEA